MRSKKTLIGAAGLAAALGVGGVIGAGFGSPGISGATPSQDTTDDSGATTDPVPADGTVDVPADAGAHRPFGEHLAVAAEALGMTEDELTTALEADGATIASIAADRGVDVQDVIDAIVADSQDELVERVTAMVNGELPDHGPGGMGGPGRGGHGFGFGGLEAAATALGTTEDDLRTQLQEDGATIASIAEAAGVDPQTVIDAMVTAATAEIDAAEADGRIDAGRATELRDALPDRITAIVNGEQPAFGGPGGMGGPGHGFPGGPPAADDDTTD